METFFTQQPRRPKVFFLAIVLFFSQNSFAQPDYNFGTGSLVSGSYRAVNSVYRYSNVKAGVDGLVTIKAIVNATIDSVDRNGIGHRAAFQPSIYANANSVGYVEFEIKFVNAGTSTAVNQAVINVTSIDVDGSSPETNPSYVIYEFDEYNFPNGAVSDYSLSGGQMGYSSAGAWYRGKNTGGVEYLDVDTTAKEVMFTMIAENTSTFLVRMGADNRNNSNSYRLRSLYFKKFSYPSSRLLPVKLEFFSAILQQGKVQLNWATSSEINASHFVVEKSMDGIRFKDAGLVFANGNSTARNTYSFQDNVESATENIIFYRLKTVDIDGKHENSSTRLIRKTLQPNMLKVDVFPNPAKGYLKVILPEKWQQKKVGIELFSANGRVTMKTERGNCSQVESLDIRGLHPGIYVLMATSNGEKAHQRIIIQ